jgi:uncharacterized integral membrane protein (TIGR00697 family)
MFSKKTSIPVSKELLQISLIALFITGLLTAQITAVKIIELSFNFTIPLIGSSILFPAGVLAYAITFLASDCYAEFYGKDSAKKVVNIALSMNILMILLIWISINLPGAEAGVPSATFASVLGPSINVVLASLMAYAVSQNLDIWIFHAIRDKTSGTKLWLRNIGSTIVSQFIDTVLFIILAFLILPSVLGIGNSLPFSVILSLVLGQYAIKFLIAIADTPLIYALVSYITKTDIFEV